MQDESWNVDIKYSEYTPIYLLEMKTFLSLFLFKCMALSTLITVIFTPYELLYSACDCMTLLYSGLRCHLEDACTSDPCHEGASCETSPINGNPICTCKKGWTGNDCSVDVNECHESEFFSLSYKQYAFLGDATILFPVTRESYPLYSMWPTPVLDLNTPPISTLINS